MFYSFNCYFSPRLSVQVIFPVWPRSDHFSLDQAAVAWFGRELDRGGPLQLLHNQPTNHYYNDNDNNNNNENIIRYGDSTALFAAHTVDTVEEEQVHLGEIVSVKCFALILGVFIHFFGANSHVAKVALVLICTLFAYLNDDVRQWHKSLARNRYL